MFLNPPLRDIRDVLETGMWPGRSHRGRGIGTATLRVLLGQAARAGARVVVADAKTHNTAALGALRRNGATLIASQDTAEINAELMPKEMEMLPPSPSTANP